jgi:hypothetical protein
MLVVIAFILAGPESRVNFNGGLVCGHGLFEAFCLPEFGQLDKHHRVIRDAPKTGSAVFTAL